MGSDVTCSVKLTVLGKSPAWQDAGGACSGYLVQEGSTSVLVDCAQRKSSMVSIMSLLA